MGRMPNESLRDRILLASAVIAVIVGAYLPWLRTNPNLPPDAGIPSIYISGMGAGFAGFDVVLLSLVGLILVLRATGTRKLFQTVLTLLTGIGTVGFCVLYLTESSLTGFSATFVPALGWFLALLGGVLLVVAGGRHLPSIIRSLEMTTALTE